MLVVAPVSVTSRVKRLLLLAAVLSSVSVAVGETVVVPRPNRAPLGPAKRTSPAVTSSCPANVPLPLTVRVPAPDLVRLALGFSPLIPPVMLMLLPLVLMVPAPTIVKPRLKLPA